MRRSLTLLVCLVGVLLVVQPAVSVGSRNVLRPQIYNAPSSDQISDSDSWWSVTGMDLNRNQIFDYLEEIMTLRDTVDIFVDYDHLPTAEDVKRLEGIGIITTGIEDLGRAIGANDVAISKVSIIAHLPNVVMVEPKMHGALYSNYATPNSKAQPSTEYSPESAWELGYSGQGVNIAIVDSGVDDAHPALMGKWVAGVEFSHPAADVFRPKDGSFNPDDTNGHGTTCAGIATGTGAPDMTYFGAAPNASLVDVRIGTAFGFGPGELIRPGEPLNIIMDGDSTLAGLRWVGEHAHDSWPSASEENDGIDILSLSWGIMLHDLQQGRYDSDGSDIYSRTLDEIVMTQGVFVVNAAGNDGPENTGLHGCAAASNTIVVAASDELDTITRDDDILADYSSRGPRLDNNDGNPYNELHPDVAAPGTGITTTTYDQVGDGSNNGYDNRGSGTSYSTPLVAGVVAMMIEANGNLTPLIAREMVRATAERKGEPTLPELDPFWNREWGWGLVDAYGAVKLAEMTQDISSLDINLQCYVMNTSSNDDEVLVEGMAWNRDGNVSHVEYRIGDGAWQRTTPTGDNGSWGSWHLRLSQSSIPVGNQTIEVRAVSDDMQSLVDWTTVKGKAFVAEEKGFEGGAGTIVAVLAMAVVTYGMWRALKDRDKKKPEPVSVPEETVEL